MEFSATSCIEFGWKTFKKRPWFLSGSFLLYVVVVSVVVSLLAWIGRGSVALIAIAALARLAFQLFAAMGLVAFILKAHDDIQGVALRDFWHPQSFWSFSGAVIVQVLMILVGFLAFIVPGVVFSVSLKLSPFFVIDKDAGPIESLFESARATRGNRWRFFELLVLTLILSVVGLLALVVGLLVTIPVASLAGAHAYRVLSKTA